MSGLFRHALVNFPVKSDVKTPRATRGVVVYREPRPRPSLALGFPRQDHQDHLQDHQDHLQDHLQDLQGGF